MLLVCKRLELRTGCRFLEDAAVNVAKGCAELLAEFSFSLETPIWATGWLTVPKQGGL